MRLLFSLVALWTIPGAMTAIYSQQPDSCSLSITGEVRDEHDNSQLDYATILILENGEGTAADESGLFSLEGLCPGTYTLRVSHVGCETRDTVVQLDRDLHLTLVLEHHVELLELINVKSAGAKGLASQAEEVLDGEELEALQGRSLAESIAGMTGVNILQTGPGVLKPVIHGMHSDRILILQNGIEQESQDWGLDHAPEIDPFFGDRITVVKGAGAVEFGTQAMGGVILVEERPLQPDQPLSGSARLLFGTNSGLASGSVDLGKGSESWAWRTHLSGRIAGDARAPGYRLTNTALREGSAGVSGIRFLKNGSVEGNYNGFFTQTGILRASHIGNLTDLQLALASDRPLYIDDFDYQIDPPRQQVAHHTWQVKVNRSTGAGDLRVQYGVQYNRRKEFDIRRGDRESKPSLDLSLWSHSADAVLTHKPVFGALRGKAGLSWKYLNNENVFGTGVKPLIPDYNLVSPSAFLTEKVLIRSWILEAGMRYTFQHLLVKHFDENNVLQKPEFEYHNFAATVGGVFYPSSGLKLSTHLGLSQRGPNVHELFSEGLHHGSAAIEYGDQDLSKESSVKWMQSVELDKSRLGFTITAFQQWFWDFIFLEPGEEPLLTIRGAFPVFYYRQTDAFLWGIDATTRFTLAENIFLNSAFSLVRANERSTGEPIPAMPADRMRHKLEWQIGKPPVKMQSLAFSLEYEHAWQQKRIPAGSDYVEPPEGFDLVHAGVNAEWQLGDRTLRTTVRLRNVLNNTYREYLNRLRYFADEAGRNLEVFIQYQF